MKFPICICLLICMHIGFAQNKILYGANNLQDTIAKRDIQKIELPWGNLGRNMLVINQNDSKNLIRKSSVWGIERNKKILRFYEGNTFELIDTNAIAIYKTYSRHPVYYFGEFLDSDVLLLTRKKVMNALGIEKFAKVYQSSTTLQRVLFYVDDYRVSINKPSITKNKKIRWKLLNFL